ncbi:MAG: ACT domain-containing protein [Opitutaceae bacterium]
MARQPGVAARFFGALGDVGVNVRAVAQGSSEPSRLASPLSPPTPRTCAE